MAATLAVGCGTQASNESEAPQPETTHEASEQTHYTAPTPGAYGSDPRLDGLYDECAAGDESACEDLYWESPVGSEYEAFAEENADIEDGEISESDQENVDEIQCQLNKATEGMSQEEIDALGEEIVNEIIDSDYEKDAGDVLAERGYTC